MSDHFRAAVALLVLSLSMGVYMSLAFRIFAAFGGKEKAKTVLESKSFKATHAAQLNNAEWAPIFIICHLYLHLKGAGSRYSAGASVAGCSAFIACKAFLFQGKPAPVAATLRYVALLWLIIEVAQTEM